MQTNKSNAVALENFAHRSDLLVYARKLYQTRSEEIDRLFWEFKPITDLLHQRAELVDEILNIGWRWFELDYYKEAALFAVGGYGNSVLHPYSDIDTLILINDNDIDNPQLQQRIEDFVSFLWDCGIELSSSVRCHRECFELAKQDHTVFTNLLTARLLFGSDSAAEYIQELTAPQDDTQTEIWPFENFFHAKKKERKNRYKQYQHTEYNQEPNIKESPGGLRDIDFLFWLSKRRYGKPGLDGLLASGALSTYEFHLILKNQELLWHMRYALHLIAKKSTDRLYLDYQSDIAKALDVQANNINQAISIWMQGYFTTASQVREITDILTQHFSEMIESDPKNHPIVSNSISAHCQQIGKHLCTINENNYLTDPSLFLKLFLHFTEIPNIKGFRADTMRFIYDYFNSQRLPELVHCPRTREYFLQIFDYPSKAAKTITLMHQLGVLSKLIPSFNALVGQMQYDLNHIYTVDAHTIRVLQFVQACYQNNDDFPYLDIAFSKALDPKILYFSALFHDIGKGKGGNHSEIGQKIALAFCQIYQLDEKQSELIAWLVLNHLKLSHFAQREDITDPNVIVKLSQDVQSQERLSYLYLLTMTDIKGTNPKLWNEWRKSLISELFKLCYTYLNEESSLDPMTTQYKKDSVLNILAKKEEINRTDVEALWKHLDVEYFENTDLQNLVWQTECILKHQSSSASEDELQSENQDEMMATAPIIGIQPHINKIGTDIFVYSKDSQGLFAYLCQTLEKLLLNIVEAKVSTTKNGFCLYSLVVVESSGQPIIGPQRLKEIKQTLKQLLEPINLNTPKSLALPHYSRHVPRWYRYYRTKAIVKVYTPHNANYTTIEIHAPDFPGLLARVGKILVTHGIFIHNAKINTLGDKVIDFFYVTLKSNHAPLNDEKVINTVKNAISKALH